MIPNPKNWLLCTPKVQRGIPFSGTEPTQPSLFQLMNKKINKSRLRTNTLTYSLLMAIRTQVILYILRAIEVNGCFGVFDSREEAEFRQNELFRFLTMAVGKLITVHEEEDGQVRLGDQTIAKEIQRQARLFAKRHGGKITRQTKDMISGNLLTSLFLQEEEHTFSWIMTSFSDFFILIRKTMRIHRSYALLEQQRFDLDAVYEKPWDIVLTAVRKKPRMAEVVFALCMHSVKEAIGIALRLSTEQDGKPVRVVAGSQMQTLENLLLKDYMSVHCPDEFHTLLQRKE